MATLALTDCYVELATIDYSSHFTSATIDYSAELLEDTAFGDTSRSRVAGLKEWSLTLELNLDYASSSIDSVLFPLVGTSVAIEIRPTSGSVSSSNPSYTGNAFLESYQPINGSVGELATASITFTGTGNLSRAES